LGIFPRSCEFLPDGLARARHPKGVPVQENIDEDRQARQPDLAGSRQVRRIEQRQEIVLDELALVGGGTTSLTKILVWRSILVVKLLYP